MTNIFDRIDELISDTLLREEMLLEEKGATEVEIVAHRNIRKAELNTWAKGVLSQLEVMRRESHRDDVLGNISAKLKASLGRDLKPEEEALSIKAANEYINETSLELH